VRCNAVLDELASRYRVDFSSPGDDSHVVELAVDARGVRGATTFIVEPPPPQKVARTGQRHLAITVPALIVVVALLSFVLRRRAGRWR